MSEITEIYGVKFFKLEEFEKLKKELIDAGIPEKEAEIPEEDRTPAKDWKSIELQNKSPVTAENITQCLKEKTSSGWTEDKLFCLIEYEHDIYPLKELLEQEALKDELSVDFRFCNIEAWKPLNTTKKEIKEGNRRIIKVESEPQKQQNQAIIIRFSAKEHKEIIAAFYSTNTHPGKNMHDGMHNTIKHYFENLKNQNINQETKLTISNLNLTSSTILAGTVKHDNVKLRFENTYFNLDYALTFTCASNQDITFWDCYTSNKEKENNSKAMLVFLKDNHTIKTIGNSENIFNIQIQEESKQKSNNTEKPNIESLNIKTLGTQKSNIKIYCNKKENIVLETIGSKNKDITISSNKVQLGNLEQNETSNKLTIMHAAITGITGYFGISIPTNSELNNCTIEDCGDIKAPENGDIKIDIFIWE